MPRTGRPPKPGNRVGRVCVHCGKEFVVFASDARLSPCLFCTAACHYAHQRATRAERFWAKVDRSGDCWVWTGRRDPQGYGRTGLSGNSSERAHRLAWKLTHGDIPAGLWVLHRCDNPPCVRPDHLFLGDNAANMADLVEKRLSPIGERNGTAKLTDEAVREMRQRHAVGEPIATLATRFGVSKSVAEKAIHGATWRHLPAHSP
jgi:hypothetical protein